MSLKSGWFLCLFIIYGSGMAQGLQVTQVESLSFGDFYFSGSGQGTLTVSADGNISTSGVINSVGINYREATFAITSQTQQIIYINFPGQLLLHRVGGGETLEVNLGPIDKGNSLMLAAAPIANIIKLGATIQVTGAGKLPGNYQGSYEIEFTVINE